ncbi:MAG: hypothetical protein LBL13_04085 [Bacteroidales bacterium]|jgi:hypothetical protein|nr:hypothetical protein [Bacteroidales bacterium]
MTNSELLISKLEQFIRTYYKNMVIRACIFFIAISSFLFITLVLFEYFTYSNSILRAILLYTFVVVNVFIICFFVIRPLLKIWGIGKRLSYEEAAKIIGKHFREIDDKLLNALQLRTMSQQQGHVASMELLHASVDEKIKQVKPFRFQAAVNLRKNLKYIKYAVIPILFIIFIFAWDYHVFTEPAQRIVKYGQYFEKPAPYHFVVENENLIAFQNENFTLNIKVEGEEIPEELFIEIENATHKLQHNTKTTFSHEFKNLQRTTDFQLFTEEARSRPFQLEVIPKPILINFSMQLEYPNYTDKPNETIENRGDITIPQGTKVTWKFNSRNTDEVIFAFDDKKINLDAKKDNSQYSMRLMQNIAYTVFNKNIHMTNSDSLQYYINIVADQYPAIDVMVINDSAFIDRFYFKGTINDDYGFTKLHFVYAVLDREHKEISKESVNIPIHKNINLQEFYYYFDAQIMNLEAGQTLEYYFEIWDNDQVNGSKSTKSTAMSFTLPTLEEIQRQSESVNQQTRTELNNLIKESESLLKNIEDLKKRMVDKNQPSWQEKKQLEDLLKQLKDMERKIENVSAEQQRQQQINEQYNTIDEQILRKQQEIQKRFNDLFSDEMKMMMEELQRLMESNIDKNKMNEMLDKIQLSSEDINKQLDQNLELFKSLEVESKMENIISKVSQLAEKQKELAEQTLQKDADIKQQQDKQNEINQEFKDLQQELRAVEKLNKELEDPYHLEKTKDLENEVSQQLNQSKEQLEKNQKPKAADSQKQAGKKMEELASQMQKNMEDDEMEDLGEDITKLRQVLDNIVKTSFQEEDLMVQTLKTNIQDPSLRQIIQNQFHLKENLKMIEDSIAAIARRQVMVEPFISKEITKINQAQEQIMELLNSTQEPSQQAFFRNRNAQIASKQQFVMTSLNDVALMIAESLKNMQKKKQQGSSSGKGNCSSDNCEGGSIPKPSKSMRQMQEQLNKQLEEARKKMEQGEKEGGNKKENKPGGQSMSEQLARMAAQQEAIRKMMQEHQSELKKEGKGYGGELDRLLKEMEQTEKDLVNKTINQQTMNRQQQILSRLLESERAEMQREQEEKRESREAHQLPNSTIPPFIEQQLNRKKEIELYKTIPPTLNHFYKDKVNAYFYHFDNN